MNLENRISQRSQRQSPIGKFKDKALIRADRDGIPKAAEDLGINETLLHAWREHARLQAEEMTLLEMVAA